MMLSSLEKTADFLGLDVGNGRVNGIDNDEDQQRKNRRNLTSWLNSISTEIEDVCDKHFLISSRTQTFNIESIYQTLFWVEAFPIVSITSVKYDPTGQFSGDETTLTTDQYCIGNDSRAVQLLSVFAAGTNVLRIVYSGGLAYDPIKSTFTLSSITGSSNISAGNYIYGSLSSAIGKIYSFSTPTLVVENIYGIFEASETLSFQPSLYAQSLIGTSAVITSIDRQSLAEGYPEVAQAIEFEIGVMNRRAHNAEMTKTSTKDGSDYMSIKDGNETYSLQPYTRSLLNRHINRMGV